MTHNIPVKCTITKTWNLLDSSKWESSDVDGVLIDISTQSSEDNSGRIIPVGIVILNGYNTFECIPMEFITKIN